MSDQQLAGELHEPIIRKFEKRKVHSLFIDNIWGADLVDMKLISKFNEGFTFWLCNWHLWQICIGYSLER